MKDFVPYEPSLELKELGFDEPCFGRYWHEDFKLINIDKQFKTPNYACLSPLYQQAFRWFREKHDLTANPSINTNGKWSAWVIPIPYDLTNLWEDGEFETYEEAELACLIKLIEIVKDEKHILQQVVS